MTPISYLINLDVSTILPKRHIILVIVIGSTKLLVVLQVPHVIKVCHEIKRIREVVMVALAKGAADTRTIATL